jgi:hypothetical protein
VLDFLIDWHFAAMDPIFPSFCRRGQVADLFGPPGAGNYKKMTRRRRLKKMTRRRRDG